MYLVHSYAIHNHVEILVIELMSSYYHYSHFVEMINVFLIYLRMLSILHIVYPENIAPKNVLNRHLQLNYMVLNVLYRYVS